LPAGTFRSITIRRKPYKHTWSINVGTLKNPHDVGEYNASAWDGAANAKRIIQQRRLLVDPKAEVERISDRLAREVRHGEVASPDGKLIGAEPDELRYYPSEDYEGSFAQRLHKLGERPIQEQMRERLVGSQAPEPVMEVVSPDGAEGAKVTRLWAVDDEEFGKKAGEEMTEDEYVAVCQRMKPVRWDEEGNPDRWAPTHDVIDPSDGTGKHVPTRAEREAAKQYAVRGLTPAVDDTPPGDTTILPDPYVEPENPDLP
jgi:hypothetical protein